MVETWDPHSEALAEHFLQDEGTIPGREHEPGRGVRRVKSLAAAIQQAVEEWFEDHPLDGGEP